MGLRAAEEDGEVGVQVALEMLRERGRRGWCIGGRGGGQPGHQLVEIKTDQPERAVRPEDRQENVCSARRPRLRCHLGVEIFSRAQAGRRRRAAFVDGEAFTRSLSLFRGDAETPSDTLTMRCIRVSVVAFTPPLGRKV